MHWLRKLSKISRSRLPNTHNENTHRAVVDKVLWIAERSDHLDRIHQQTSLPKELFEQLFLIPLQRYAARVQKMPAQQKPYAYPGGFLDHSLALIEGALRLRRSRLLPAGAAPEEQAQQAEAWSAALVYAALLDEMNMLAQLEMDGIGNGLVLLVDQSTRDWLRSFPELWSQLDITFTTPRTQASALAELIDQARRALDGSPPASQDQRGVSSESMEALINHDYSNQAPAATHSNEDNAAENPGQAFLLWLRRLITQQQLSVNQDNSKVHIIDGHAFICSPALFQRYSRELKTESFPEDCCLGWRNVQRRFEALQVHRKSPDRTSLWNCSLARPDRKPRRYSGYLLKADALFTITPPDNPNLRLLTGH